jgi:hypothetical protein
MQNISFKEKAMGKRVLSPIGLAIAVSLVIAISLTAGCVNMKYVTESAGPAITEMANVRTLGIVSFNVTIEFNRLILEQAGNMEGAVIVGGSYPGVDKQVMVVVTAPEAASKYYITRFRLSKLARDVWAQYLSGSVPFDYAGANEKWMTERVSSSNEQGGAIGGFPKVIAIPEEPVGFDEPASLVATMAGQYGVDALLACDMRVYAEVIKATTQPPADASGLGSTVSLVDGQYALKIEITYQWALFDGKTGKRIADSTTARIKFINQKTADKTIFPLPVTISQEYQLDQFMASPDYAAYFRQSIANALMPYLYFFVPHYHGYYVEVKEEKK